MAQTAGEVQVVVDADVAAALKNLGLIKSELNKLDQGDTIGKLGKQFESAGKKMTMGLTLPIVAGFGLATNEFLKFDEVMTKIQAVTGMSGDEIGSLGNTAKELAKDTTFSAEEVANGMYWIADSTTSAADIQNYLSASMNLAATSGADLGETAQTLQGMMMAYGIDSSQAAEVTDVLTAAFQNSLWTGDEFNSAMSYVGATASSIGVPFKSTAAALDVLSRSGYAASTAGAALRMGLVRLVNPSKEAEDVIKNAGLTMNDVNPEAVGLETALKNLGKANLSAAEAAEIFGVEAMGPMLSLIQSSDGDFQELIENFDNSGGAAQDAADIVNQSASAQFKSFINDLKTLAIDIGSVLIPALKGIVDFVRPIVRWFGNLDSGTKTLIVTILGIVAAVGPVLIVLGKAMQMFKMVKMALSTLQIFIAGFTITPMGIAIMALIALVALIIYYWDDLKPYFEALWQGIQDVWNQYIGPLVDIIVDVFEEIYNFLKPFFDWLIEFIGGALEFLGYMFNTYTVPFFEAVYNVFMEIYNFLKPIMEGIYNFLVTVLTAIAWAWDNILRPIIDIVIGIMSFIGEYIIGYLTGIWQGIEVILQAIQWVWDNVLRPIIDIVIGILSLIWEGFTKYLGWIGDVVDAAIDGIIWVWDNVFKPVVDTVTGILTDLYNVFDMIFGWITDVVDDAVGWIMDMIDAVAGPINDLIGGIGDFVSDPLGSIGSFLGFAEGGYVTGPTLAVVGEAGPEYIVPEHKMEDIINSRTVVGYAGEGRASNMVMNFYGSSAEDNYQYMKHQMRMEGVRFGI